MRDELIWKEAAESFYETVMQLYRDVRFEHISNIRLFNLYLVACRLYYQENISIMTDTLFDSLCKYLLDNYEEIKEEIWHKNLLDKELLKAGTGYSLSYPAPIYLISQHYIRILQ